MTEEDEEDYRTNNICQFFEKNIDCDKVRDHCHLTGKYRRPAHNISNINVTQDQSSFIAFIIHNFGNYDSHMFLNELVNKKMIK